MGEEFYFRHFLLAVLKHKWMVIASTGFCVLLAAIYSFLMVPKQYEGRATVMVTQGRVNLPQSGSSIDGILQALFKQPEMTLETYRSQVTNPVIMKQVIDELKLDANKYSLSSLTKEVKAEAVKNTNNINIIVRSANPKEASLIANSVANHFVIFTSDMNRQQFKKSIDFIEKQIIEQKKSFDNVMEEYKKFLSQPRGVQQISAEISAKTSLLTGFGNKLVENEVEKKKTISALTQVENELAQTPEKLTLKRSLLDDALLSGDRLSSLSVDSEVINQIYVKVAETRAVLRVRLAEFDGHQSELLNSINKIEQELRILQVELADKKAEEEQLSQKLSTIKNNYQLLSTRRDEIQLNQIAKTGEASINVIAPSLEGAPVESRGIIYMAAAGILGSMGSIFLVFFLEYFRGTEQASNKL